MANDVTIVVEASLGDTLLKLELAKHAIGELDDAGTTAGKNLGDDSNRNSFSSRVGNLQKRLSNLGDRGPLGMVTRAFGNLASAMIEPIELGAKFAKNFESLGSVGQVLVGAFASLTIGIAAFAAVVAAAVLAGEALATVLGTLVAIVADFVAPLTLVVGLLGLLGIGFGIAAKRASEGGGKLSAFSKELDTLKSMFGRTSDILAHVFLPYLMELAHAGERALFFLDKVAKLPLKEAFQKISTEGVQLLTKFINRVAEVTAQPIRLAFKLAFGTGPADNEFASSVAAWWHRFTDFLFGYTEHHPITKLDILKGMRPTQEHVDGIFEPLIEWFNRHHFTRQGIQIGRQILRGVLDSDMRNRMSDFMVDVMKDAGKKSAMAYLVAVRWMIRQFILLFTVVPRKLVSLLEPAWGQIKTAASAAWNWIKTRVENIWQAIVDFVTSPLHINIDWPSPPAWVTDWIGGGAGGGGGPIHPDPGGTKGDNSVVIAQARPRMAMAAAGGIHIHVHGADLSDGPTQRRIAQKLGKAIAQDWKMRAGGH